MVTTVPVIRAGVVIEVPRNQIVMIAVPINSAGVIVIVPVVVTNRAPVLIAVAVVAWVVTARGAGVIRRVTLTELNAQAARSERKTLCFRWGSISDSQQADCEHWGCDPFDQSGHGKCLG